MTGVNGRVVENRIFTGFFVGMAVISTAGRDKGSPMIIVGFEGDRVLVADGDERPLERPKKKNPRHLTKTRATVSPESMKSLTNRSLRRILREMSEKQ